MDTYRFDKIFYTGSPAVGKHVLTEPTTVCPDITVIFSGKTKKK